ncbi:aspartate aminotransferase family protein [Paenibacillus sp. MMS20-IR301]|uniref:pyridoxal phosphate-dependent decarboxylase family protein n=1 Tax=Paenibacillus sp. MMS20-IR301 TaxID=2895946 RepID=UPI0028EAD162|nr:aspartate aminotransferase family protein [Paenibacillus sp. MMS20-IR301]WNS43952.1 aspartate aminotransferase family protein [Paenibacillus sp. MMS20-IR301]
MAQFQFPVTGTAKQEVLEQLQALRGEDANWREGRTWSLVYYGGEEIADLTRQAYQLFSQENGLNPGAFPSLRQMETEVVSMTADLLGGSPGTAGNMTSGGTESILMAVKTARDHARATRPEISQPELLLPVTAHPAFSKAAAYFDIKPVYIPLTEEYRADVSAARQLINENTILLAGSAPAYPHGVIDPIAELAALALRHQLPFHVDACLGGFMLPFLKDTGEPIPDFDFRVPGVTSMSADLHKYGYAAKGASVVLYREDEYRQHQFYVRSDWPGGLFASPTMAGTRPGGAIAAAWAVLRALGRDGYSRLADTTLQITRRLQAALASVPELYILGNPRMSVFAVGSEVLNLYAVADELERRGWHMDRQHLPPSLHFMVTPAHRESVDIFIIDLHQAIEQVQRHPEAYTAGSTAMYGMVGSLPDPALAHGFMRDYLSSMTRRRQETE